ncbi:MAG: hypothetical protein CMJ78_15440 [Planctomycetaceae bacterium]|nr:hypothetical protein [Planctomycetaceae bacterium]
MTLETNGTPKEIGPYEIERRIGAGGMGTVYLGRHKESGKQAAVKVLPSSLAREPGFVERFTREIESLRKLKNPHVVELYEDGVSDETYYYAMEYVEGETVTDRIRREKRLPWEDVIQYAIQICSALKAAHNAGIIHRDLKPSNLLVATDGMLKLTDFGVAQLFATNKLTATGGIIGTAEYMSPEQAQGKRTNKQSDLYSLGAVMYTMICGRPPFVGKTTLDLVQKHRYGQFDKPSRYVPDIPQWLEDIVCKLLSKKPEDRFPDAYVLSLRLQEVLKRIERAGSEETAAGLPIEDEPEPAEDSEVSLMRTTATAGARGSSTAGGPGQGTLMRDLMKMEIERANQETVLPSIFNNTWFLVGCLVFLIIGGILWFQDPADSTDMDSLTAGNSESIRLLELARHYQRLGDVIRAEKTLEALLVLIKDDEQYKGEHRRAKLHLERLRKDRAERLETFLKPLLERAQQLLQTEDEEKREAAQAQAHQILTSITTLYRGDRLATDYVKQAEAMMNHPEEK